MPNGQVQTQNQTQRQTQRQPTGQPRGHFIPEVQGKYLAGIAKNNPSTTIYLISGIRLNGELGSFDSDSLTLNTLETSMLVFTHGIASLNSH